MDFLIFILSCLYFFLPAYFANMTPPLARRANLFNFLDKDIDFGQEFLGKPILGNHKCWRGVILGVLVGISIAALQYWLYYFFIAREISFLNYQEINILLFGFLMSFGAIFGDLFFAFIKRRLSLKPGAMFIPFDQTNYVIGAFLFLTPYVKIDILIWLNLFLLTFLLHIIINRLGYHLKLHCAKW